MRQIVIATCFIVLLTISSPSQTTIPSTPKPTPEEKSEPAPGGIVLLKDYVHTKKRGIDTSVGEIKGTTGIVIRYDNGPLAGNLAWRMNNQLPRLNNVGVLWYQEQVTNGLHIYLLRGEDNSIYASFPETCANFFAFNVNEQQLADFLLMMMTYHEKPYANVRMKDGRPTC